jgi:hypothetical protein
MLKYGLRVKSLQEAAAVSELFGLQFELHNSSFRGGDYLLAEVQPGSIYIQSNHDLLDDEPFEALWPLDQFLICFAGLDDEKWEPYTRLLAPLEASNDIKFIMKRSVLSGV